VSIEQAGPPRFMRAGTKEIITGKAAADWRREAEAAAGEGRRDGSAEAAAFGHVPRRRHPANEIKQRTNASKIEQAERAEPPLEPTLKSTRVERLLTPKEAANLLRLSPSWLAKARMRGDGPPYAKLGRSIRYGEGALLQWMKAHLRLSTSER
jgi:predicted DNA-binding transcriptional regulator AlpA